MIYNPPTYNPPVYPPSTPPTYPPVLVGQYNSSTGTFTTGAVAFCGDGILQAGERCDYGVQNGQPGQNCTTTCQALTVVTCGNGTTDGGEECDDGNARSGDGCSAQCRTERGICGDGKTNAGLGEECDAGQQNGLPSSDCDAQCKWVRLSECGDGKVDPAMEQCDGGKNNGNYSSTRCLDNCMLPYCGDSITEVNEECDDGNTFDGDGCDHACREENAAASPFVGSVIPNKPRNTGIPAPVDIKKIPTPARTETGPGLVIFLISGAAAGIGLVRRRILSQS